MWVAYARTVLAQHLAGRRDGDLDPTVVAGFEAYLDEWDHTAAAGDGEFLWSVDVDADQARYLAHAFFNVASGLATEAEARGFPISPSEGDEFYRALVTSLLDTMTTEGGPVAAFAEDLRDRWPGLKDDPDPR